MKNVEWQEYVALRQREGARVSQITHELASITAQSPATVWNWLAGKKGPSRAAQRLLNIWWHLPPEQRDAFFV